MEGFKEVKGLEEAFKLVGERLVRRSQGCFGEVARYFNVFQYFRGAFKRFSEGFQGVSEDFKYFNGVQDGFVSGFCMFQVTTSLILNCRVVLDAFSKRFKSF